MKRRMRFFLHIAVGLFFFLSESFAAKENKMTLFSPMGKSMERAFNFLEKEATKVPQKDYAKPYLRTESGAADHRTLELRWYADEHCTNYFEIDNVKLGACSPRSGGSSYRMMDIVSEAHGSFEISSADYLDKDCGQGSVDPGSITSKTIKKDLCTSFNGAYVKINVMGKPQKSTPEGGNAWVYYTEERDCKISKHTNWGRAVFWVTFPLDGCLTGFLDGKDAKSVSCDATGQVYHKFDTDNGQCHSTGTPTTVNKINSDYFCEDSIDGYWIQLACVSQSE
jgi:hypothetical protein